MSLLHSAKKRAAAAAGELPPGVARELMRFNRRAHWVYGPRYRAYRGYLREHEQHFDNTSLLLQSANHALAHVPFYRQRYSRTLATLDDFEQLGFITKDDVLGDFDGFLADDVDTSDYDTVTTGGTSGKPLTLAVPKDRYIVELATMHSLWGRAGFDHHVRAVIRNHRLPEGVPYRVNPVTREVLFDGFDLTPDALSHIWRSIQRLGLRFVHAYPSTATELARHIRDSGDDPSQIRAFLSGSENIFDYQRDLIEGELGIRFYNWYGHSEKLVLAGYCEKTRHYHHEPTYGHLELVDEEGKVIREPGRTGEIVGSSFHNRGMPLLRYRTGDFATYVGDRCEACGRRLPVFRDVKGRWSGDRIYNADGTYVTTTALNLHDDLYQVIDGLQYVQDVKGELTVCIVPSPSYHHDERLLAHFRGRLAPDTVVRIAHVERLRRKPNGKFVHLMSTVSA